MSIIESVNEQSYKMQEFNNKPTIINLSVDQAFLLLEEVNEGSFVPLSDKVSELLLTRNEDELLKYFNDGDQKMLLHGLPVKVYRMVE